ncbi:MAG: hypothetical protein ACLFQB_06795 [Chitinispirillaceae bacterium]
MNNLPDNQSSPGQHPFHFLDGTINLLFLDDQPLVLDLLEAIFEPVKLYSLHKAPTSKKALELLSSDTRIHACVMDLGVKDLDDDEFTILKRFGSGVSFIVLTGSHCPSKGFDAYRLGAKAVVEKSGHLEGTALLKAVNKHALENILNPHFHEQSEDTSSISTKMLLQHSPETVTRWAQQLGITDRQLRKIWKNSIGFSAKTSLFTFNLFQQAFLFYENMLQQETEVPSFDLLTISTDQYRKIEEYFFLHRSSILNQLA